MKDYKSEQNPLKMLKLLKGCFFRKLQGLSHQLCRKINSATNIFQLIYLPFKSVYLLRKISKKELWILTSNIHYVTQSVLLLIFSCSSVRSTYQLSTFYKTRMNHWNGQHLLSSAIIKKERQTPKVQCGSFQWKV